MTPREPDRFEAKARELVRRNWIDYTGSTVDHVAVALRQAANEALERAAQAFENRGPRIQSGYEAAALLRALASPAAAPAAEKVRCMCPPGAVAGSCPLRNDVQSICECRCHDAPSSEPVAPAPSQAMPPDPEGDRNRHNAMLVEAWREEFHRFCDALFPGHDGMIGWKHIHAKIAEREKRIAELEGLLRRAAQHVAWRGVEDKRAEALFARIDAALSAASPPAPTKEPPR